MKKAEVVRKVAKQANMTITDTEKVLNLFLDTIEDALAEGEEVRLVGFGSFEVRTRAGRVGKNPRTGEDIQIPTCKLPAFRAGKALKEKVQD